VSDGPAPLRRTVGDGSADPEDGSAEPQGRHGREDRAGREDPERHDGHVGTHVEPRSDDRSEPGQGDPRRGEGPLQQADRNMIEMLQELRVAQTGIQILFAFLLSLSFTDRFGRIDDVQRWTYVVTLLMTTLTTGLLVAPAAVHRVLFGRRVKLAVVRVGQQLFVAGLIALALTLMGAVLLVLDIAIGRSLAIPITAAVGVMLVGLWFVLPLPVLRRSQREEPDEPDAQARHARRGRPE
jgi:Family of unknown function (DUF6328)